MLWDLKVDQERHWVALVEVIDNLSGIIEMVFRLKVTRMEGKKQVKF